MSTLAEIERELGKELLFKMVPTVLARSHRGDQMRRDALVWLQRMIEGDTSIRPNKRTKVAHRLIKIQRAATVRRIRQQLEADARATMPEAADNQLQVYGGQAHDPAQENEQA